MKARENKPTASDASPQEVQRWTHTAAAQRALARLARDQRQKAVLTIIVPRQK